MNSEGYECMVEGVEAMLVAIAVVGKCLMGLVIVYTARSSRIEYDDDLGLPLKALRSVSAMVNA